MKNKYRKNHNLSTKMAIILGASKIMIGISTLFASLMLLVVRISGNNNNNNNMLPMWLNLKPVLLFILVLKLLKYDLNH